QHSHCDVKGTATHAHTHTHTHTHTHMHFLSYIHTHTQTHTLSLSHTYTHRYTCPCKHTQIEEHKILPHRNRETESVCESEMCGRYISKKSQSFLNRPCLLWTSTVA